MTNSSYVQKNLLKIKIHKNGTVFHSCKCLISGLTVDNWIQISLLHSICYAITFHEDSENFTEHLRENGSKKVNTILVLLCK